MADGIRVRRDVVDRLLQEARRDPTVECCGLLCGREGIIDGTLPAANTLASATAFEVAATDLFRLMREMRSAGSQLMGIYHSHPVGENYPSQQDVERAYYPDAAYFILSPLATARKPVRAFSICEGRVVEKTVEVI